MEDITDILAFEIKKEMADRYFGFRKQIEDDTAAYTRRLTLSALELENKIGFALNRLYILLHDKSLISSFVKLVGLPEDLFYDPYIIDSVTIRKRVFKGLECRGFTRKSRFLHMFFDAYDSLCDHIEEYRETLTSLSEEQETIREEINIFYRKNDIDTILGFIRRLDSSQACMLSDMQPPEKGRVINGLSDQMRIHPPLQTCEILPTIPALPAQKDIYRPLKELAVSAFTNSMGLDVKALTQSTA
jgi:hypothetical protein